MRLLFTIDTQDYDNDGSQFIRPSSRAIIIKNRKIAMIHSLKYDYYKFPGGGIENNEDRITALVRDCLLYTSPSPRDRTRYRMPSSAWKKKTYLVSPL